MSNQKEYEQFCTITGVIDNNIVQQSTLDEFVKRHPEVMIVDDDTSVFDIAKKYASEHKVDGTLFFIDCSAFHNQYKHWYGSFKIIQPYYAMKCNPNEVILDLMATLPNICFDCASPGEIVEILNRGISPRHIIYANTIKSNDNIKYFRDHDVWCSTVDCPEEIEKMHNILGDDFKKCRLVVRLWVDDSHSINSLGSKFGAHPKEIAPILEKIKEYGGTVVGTSFHVGSGCHDAVAYKGAIENCRTFFDLCKQYDFHPVLIDLGGGWKGSTEAEEPEELPSRAKVVFDSLKQYNFDLKDLMLISEPGRYFNDHTITMVTPVFNAKEYEDRMVYTLSEGIYGGFKEHFLSNIEYEPEVLTQRIPCKEPKLSSIQGPSGHLNDVVKVETQLPPLSPGDLIIWKNAGAYTMSEASKCVRDHYHQNIFFVRRSSLSENFSL